MKQIKAMGFVMEQAFNTAETGLFWKMKYNDLESKSSRSKVENWPTSKMTAAAILNSEECSTLQK